MSTICVALIGLIALTKEAKAKLVEAVDDGAGGGGDFQCPICMKKFNDPEILIKHHQQAHDESNKV